MITTENIDCTIAELKTDEEFIKYVQTLWDENETDNNEANLERPETVHESMIYIINYTEIEIKSID